MKVVGTPSEEGLYFVTNQKARRFVMNLPRYEPVDLVATYPTRCSDAGADLLRQMLVLDPNRRISVQDALAHEYFRDVRDDACEGLAAAQVNWGDIETCELTKLTLQNLLLSDFEALEKDKSKFLHAPQGAHTGPSL
jgi:serine/threonine protein kinase